MAIDHRLSVVVFHLSVVRHYFWWLDAGWTSSHTVISFSVPSFVAANWSEHPAASTCLANVLVNLPLKACPHWRLLSPISATICRRKRQLSTVAEFCGDSVDRASDVDPQCTHAWSTFSPNILTLSSTIDIQLLRYTCIGSVGRLRNAQHSQGMCIVRVPVIHWRSRFRIVQLSCTDVHSLPQKKQMNL